MDEQIKVWNGHHPKPDEPTVMGTRWLQDHFDSVYFKQYDHTSDLLTIKTVLIGFAIIQLIFDGALAAVLLFG